MAFDAATGQTMMYGGYATAIPATDTWVWDGAQGTWTNRKISPPSVFDMMATTYDSTRGRVVIFGGEKFPSAGPSADLWEWSGAAMAWSNRTPKGALGTWPAARLVPSAAYDSARHRVVVHGGAPGDDTWEWDPDGGTWSNRSTTPSPVTWNGEAFVWDPVRNRGVLFGGATGAELWEWDGVSGQWTQRDHQSGVPWPEARSYAGMVFDPTVNRVLLFGGRSDQQRVLNDLWEWDGGTNRWIPLDENGPPARPPGRYWAGVVFDTVRSRLVVFGGGTEMSDLGDVWEWARP